MGYYKIKKSIDEVYDISFNVVDEINNIINLIIERYHKKMKLEEMAVLTDTARYLNINNVIGSIAKHIGLNNREYYGTATSIAYDLMVRYFDSKDCSVGNIRRYLGNVYASIYTSKAREILGDAYVSVIGVVNIIEKEANFGNLVSSFMEYVTLVEIEKYSFSHKTAYVLLATFMDNNAIDLEAQKYFDVIKNIMIPSLYDEINSNSNFRYKLECDAYLTTFFMLLKDSNVYNYNNKKAEKLLDEFINKDSKEYEQYIESIMPPFEVVSKYIMHNYSDEFNELKPILNKVMKIDIQEAVLVLKNIGKDVK